MNQKMRMIMLISIFITFSIAFVIYIILPEKIVAHQNAAGVVTRYGNKAEVLITPSLVAVVQLLFVRYWQWIHTYTLKRNSGNGTKLAVEKSY